MSADRARLAVGTQVVLPVGGPDVAGALLPAGVTGKVSALIDDGGYLIDFPAGRQARRQRDELTLRKSYQDRLGVTETVAPMLEPADLVRQHTIFAAVVGSRAFGLATHASDTDVRGVYAAPAAAFFGLVKPPPHVDGPEPERFSWELERFCELALKANPNLLEVLHSPLVLFCTDLGEELLGLRPAFLSQLAYQTYSGYVLSQFKKLEADFRTRGAPKWKHVMHLLRLLICARELLLTGRVQLAVGPDRDRLLAVRRGEMDWTEVERWRHRLHEELDRALPRSPLPVGPDAPRVDRWLRSVRARSIHRPGPGEDDD